MPLRCFDDSPLNHYCDAMMREMLPPGDPDRPILIAGPTASGKSALAVELAEGQGRAVVNADALQVYAGWPILTACPGPGDLACAPHHLYAHVPHDHSYSVGDWLRDVLPLLNHSPAPVIVGGTGLYFMALTEGLVEIPAIAPALRDRSETILASSGVAALLADLDPLTVSRIDTRNPKRVQRAWEVQQQTGRSIAAWQDDTGSPILPEAKATCYVLNADPGWLAGRIERRFDGMIAKGAVEEARRMEADWDPTRPSSKAIGAVELIRVIRGEMPMEEAIATAKLRTRQYAKRQRTWFRARMSGWIPLTAEELVDH
jgi:tRNA dimethylallyltransferase